MIYLVLIVLAVIALLISSVVIMGFVIRRQAMTIAENKRLNENVEAKIRKINEIEEHYKNVEKDVSNGNFDLALGKLQDRINGYNSKNKL